MMMLSLFFSFYLFVGIEVIGKEHTTHYDFFIKKHPTTQMKFYNQVLCGECDFRPFKILSFESQKNFQNLCYYRYDLTDIKQCENLFKPD